MSKDRSHDIDADWDDAGFTLIEMIVALVILSISFGTLLAAFSAHMDRLALTRNEDKARRLAVALLARSGDIGTPALGQTADGLAWQISIAPYGGAADRTAWRFAAEQATVTVTFGAHHVSLSTLRVAKP
jgi:general secretion pathway protein I